MLRDESAAIVPSLRLFVVVGPVALENVRDDVLVTAAGLPNKVCWTTVLTVRMVEVVLVVVVLVLVLLAWRSAHVGPAGV